MAEMTNSGIQAVGEVPWGSHLCQFYETAEDLVDILVPYFKAGLEANEKCLWAVATPLSSEEILACMGNAVPDLAARMARGQFDVVDARHWYRNATKMGADELLAVWVGLKDQALDAGFNGLRVSGNTYFLEAGDWQSFIEYEAMVTQCFCDHRIIALCSYCLSRCDANGVLDVVQNHEFALARRAGEWISVESGAMKAVKAQLRRSNEELEHRVAARTGDLSQALEELHEVADSLRQAVAQRDVLLQEVHHRVKNNLQIIASLLTLKATRTADANLREAFDDTLRRITAMGLVHEALYRQTDCSSIDFGEYLDALAGAMLDSFGLRDRIRYSVDAADEVLDLTAAVPLGLIAAEAVSNACKHAFPGGRPGNVAIRFRAASAVGDGELSIADDGIGIDAAPSTTTSGLSLAKGIARQVDGRLAVRTDGGTQVVLRFPVPGAVEEVYVALAG